MQANEENSDSPSAPAEAQGFLALVVAGIAIGLAALVPVATRTAPLEKGWWVEPKTWPLICLLLTLLAAVLPIRNWAKARTKATNRAEFIQNSRWAFGDMGITAEYSAYFCLYLFLMNYVGFAASSMVFTLFAMWRSGLRSLRWQWLGVAFVVGTVISFRVLMQLWFPMPSVFEKFPAWFVQNIAIYL